MSAVDILRAARALIEEKWCQGKKAAADLDRRYGYCVASALACSERRLSAPYAECRAARDAMQTAIGADYTGIIGWNDAPERTKEEVLAAYDRAITAAKEAA